MTNENNIPIEFSLDGNNWSTELSNIVASNNTILPIGSGIKAITVQWRWVFDGDTTTDTNLGTLTTAPTITVQATITATQLNYVYSDQLAEQYQFSYYSSLSEAMTVINDGTYTEEGTTTKDSASAAIYLDENNIPNLVLLEDTTLDERLTPTTDVVINLAGNTLTFTTTVGVDASKDYPSNVTIDGRESGSTIAINQADASSAKPVQARAGNFTILGGTYIGTSNGANSSTIYVSGGANLSIEDATVIANDISGTSRGFSISSGATATITDCEIITTASTVRTYGVYNSGNTIITDTTIKTYANYDTESGIMSQGIVNTDVLTVKNSYVMGSHSGIQNAGTLYIDGGIYEGYGHGGIYFSGENTVSYVKNATIRACDMPEGYTAVNSAGGTGFYIGGANNISVYMDNNDISGDVYSFTIRDTSNEENNTLYISNSRIGGASSIRIDNTTHTIYNGTGNNFTSSAATLPDAVIDTNVDYSESFPEY